MEELRADVAKYSDGETIIQFSEPVDLPAQNEIRFFTIHYSLISVHYHCPMIPPPLKLK